MTNRRAWVLVAVVLAACGDASSGPNEGAAGSAGDSGGSAGRVPTGGEPNSGQSGATAGGATNAGAANAGAANAGAPATGGVASVGGGGATSGRLCTETDGGPNRRVRGTATGTNGTFEDTCEDGWQVEYYYETEGEPEVATGRVQRSRSLCGGTCEDGICFPWCPNANDTITFVEARDSEVVLENARSLERYQCEVTFAQDGHDCASAGTRRVNALFECSATDTTFATDTPEQPGVEVCRFACVSPT